LHWSITTQQVGASGGRLQNWHCQPCRSWKDMYTRWVWSCGAYRRQGRTSLPHGPLLPVTSRLADRGRLRKAGTAQFAAQGHVTAMDWNGNSSRPDGTSRGSVCTARRRSAADALGTWRHYRRIRGEDAHGGAKRQPQIVWKQCAEIEALRRWFNANLVKSGNFRQSCGRKIVWLKYLTF